ncbi:hypothetical protein LCGC14_3051740 [marine sediment metagenome]|uniref:N-acetyltransferase domain-containing protein n=1 Tax=marine sediment metagenome TaxID=412755 RepID=A0A0F8X9P0_9ZZZZ
MKIINANTLSAKDVLLETILKIKTSHESKTIDRWLTFNLGTDLFNAWIMYEKDEPVGIITGEVVNSEGQAVFIAFNYIKPGMLGNQELLQKVENWAKKMDVNRLLFYTKRSPMTFIKKYGFELVQSVLRKDI